METPRPAEAAGGANVFTPKAAVPPPPPPPPPPVEEAPPEPKRPFWKDPIVQIGAAGPTIVLTVFFGYLYKQRSERLFTERVHAWNAKAIGLAKQGKNEEAYEAFRVVADSVKKHPTDDAQVNAEAESAETMVRNLEPGVVAAREERERVAREEADKAAQRAAHVAEAERLSKLRSDVSGDAWVAFTSGSEKPLRGLRVYFVPAEVPRPQVPKALDKMVAKAALFPALARFEAAKETGAAKSEAEALVRQYETVEKVVKQFADPNSDRPLESREVLLVVRGIHGDTLSNGKHIVSDAIWPLFLEESGARFAETNISGHFTLEGLPGGWYYVYALYYTDNNLIEWLVPLKVEKSGPLTFNLHNDKARVILNNRQKDN